MKRSKFTDSQIMEALKRVEAGLPVPGLCREFGMSATTFYKWRAKFGGMDTSMMARMKDLEDENRRLKKLYIDEKLKAQSALTARSGQRLDCSTGVVTPSALGREVSVASASGSITSLRRRNQRVQGGLYRASDAGPVTGS